MSKGMLKRLSFIPLLMVIWVGVGLVVGKNYTNTYPEAQSYGAVIGAVVGLFWGALFFFVRQRKDL